MSARIEARAGPEEDAVRGDSFISYPRDRNTSFSACTKICYLQCRKSGEWDGEEYFAASQHDNLETIRCELRQRKEKSQQVFLINFFFAPAVSSLFAMASLNTQNLHERHYMRTFSQYDWPQCAHLFLGTGLLVCMFFLCFFSLLWSIYRQAVVSNIHED